jgi:hypothetical protein
MKGRANNYTAQELAWLEEHCAFSTKDLGRFFRMFFAGRDDVTDDALRNACQRHGWLTGRTGCFAKGTVPPNKGRKGWHPPGCEKGWFRKGQRPPNHRGPGHEYLDTKDGYIWLIVAGPSPYKTSTSVNSHAVMKHRYLWEQANGPIPPKHVLRCKDGNKRNCDPSNWWLIPMAIQTTLNKWSPGFDGLPIEAKEALITRALLKKKMREIRAAEGLLTPQERWHERQRERRQALAA